MKWTVLCLIKTTIFIIVAMVPSISSYSSPCIHFHSKNNGRHSVAIHSNYRNDNRHHHPRQCTTLFAKRRTNIKRRITSSSSSSSSSKSTTTSNRDDDDDDDDDDNDEDSKRVVERETIKSYANDVRIVINTNTNTNNNYNNNNNNNNNNDYNKSNNDKDNNMYDSTRNPPPSSLSGRKEKSLTFQLQEDIADWEMKAMAKEREKNDANQSGQPLEAIKNIVSFVLIADFFVVIVFLLWFIVAAATQKTTPVILERFQDIFQPVVVPSLTVLMAGSIASGLLGDRVKEDNTKS